ncbi:MlaD family protein [Nocardia sp. CDC159]|uniref:MlaD family protein n=1 Tax=Nocardia pulmonis TaxID=2951408 RepID=A0A9X2E1N4_9NOCA|nr:MULTISPECIES: MlaD family protein [Nocardia]MCM6772572.1 MlaD family protein [Nocardia pulmonis]MCM6784770.1 MlaD family protein [Nocardia sp. CDC159]
MNPLEPFARVLVRLVRLGVARKLLLSTVAQAVVVLVAVAYLMFGALRANPFAEQLTVRVELAESGGLLAGQDVTLRGIPIGRVVSVRLHEGGVEAVARIDAAARIPRDGTIVRVSGMSPAGEQYLDFQPDGAAGPPLTDGSVIGRDRTRTPIALWQVLGDIDGLLAQADPAKLKAIVDELGVGPDGPGKLRDLLSGAQLLLSTLAGALPQTMTLLRSSRPVFQLIDTSGPGLRRAADDLAATLSGLGAKDGGMRTLLDASPRLLRQADALIADNSPTMVQLLGNLTTITQLAYIRLPALRQLFRDDRGSVLEAVTSTMHGGGIWAVANLYFRHFCDYPHPRDVPFVPNYPEPFLYSYCPDDDPGLLIRGARNAPRPPGDDTANPPPGLHPHQRTDPTPVGPHTIPLPYGGPTMPPESEPQRHGGN